jgi:hypothetical protein
MARPKDPRAPLLKGTRDSRFVFTGTVEHQGSSSLFFIPPGGATAIVRVERIHYAAPALRSQEGQQVTVVFAEGSDRAEGRRVFFTNPILYGETMAVKEVRGSEADDPALRGRIARMSEEAETEHLRDLVGSADAVVQGQVVSTRRASEPDVARMSEHDPDWHVAVIRVARSLKGEHKGEIAVRFPKSRDIAWYRVPKLREGQEGILLLHRDGLELGGARLAILRHDDLLSSDAESVRRITEALR